MALTRLDYTGDNTTTVYDVSFALGYLKQNDIYVYLAGDSYTTQLSYSFLNATQIVLDAPIGTGVEFHVRRVVERDVLINDYQKGAILRENNLDDSFLQSLMILEEIEDGYLVAEGNPKLNSALDMNGNKIINLGDPTNAQDGVPKKVTDSLASRVSSLESTLGTSAGAIILVYDYTSLGGETVLDIPYTLVDVHAVTINGVRQIRSTVTSDGAWELDTGVINIAEPLEVGDVVSVDVVEIST